MNRPKVTVSEELLKQLPKSIVLLPKMMQTYQQEVARPDRPRNEMPAESGTRLQPRKMASNESVVSYRRNINK